MEFLGELGVVGLSVHAGFLLWKLRPGAVRAAKRFLLVLLAWRFVAFALPYMGGSLPSRVIDAMTVEVGKEAFRAVIVVAIWYSYFNVSKRVKATFPEG